MSSTARLGSLRRVYKAEIKLAAGLRSFLEARGVEFASKFILVVGRIWFLVVAGPRSPFPGWFSA